MTLRMPWCMLGWLLALAAVAWAQSSAIDLATLWRSGRFDEARQMLDARYSAGDRTPEFLADAARCAAELHDYTRAAKLWQEAAQAAAGNDSQYLAAREQAWRALHQAAGLDPHAPWVATAREELAGKLAKTGAKAAGRQALLEQQWLLDNVVQPGAKPVAELRTDYPRSTAVLRAAKLELDRIATLAKPQQRAEAAQQFLKDYPGCYWRHGAYRYLLNAAWQQLDKDKLRIAAAQYLKEYPDHPDSHGAVSRYFLDADIERKEGQAHAQRSVELYQKQLGSDGTLESLRKLNARTLAAAPLPDYMPPNLRQQCLSYFASRYNSGRYAIAAGQAKAALAAVQPVIDCQPFTPDEEDTLAPFYVIAGQAAQAQGDNLAACKYFLGALVTGDSRGRTTPLALSGYTATAAKLGSADLLTVAGTYVPEPLRGSILPQFTDRTAAAGLEGLRAQRAAWGDYDGDGKPDLLLNGASLLRNNGGGKFSDVTQAAGLQRGKQGGVFGDIDNDGDLDLYAFAAGRDNDRLYRNEGGRFVDVTVIFGGVTDAHPSEAAAFIDYDNDGWLDLYVANGAVKTSDGTLQGAPDLLYRNTGGGQYAAVPAQQSGLEPPFSQPQSARSICIGDADSDGRSDIFVSNASLQENLLWQSTGTGFASAGRAWGVAGFDAAGRLGDSAGSAWGDYDNDGDLDLFTCNLDLTSDGWPAAASQLMQNTPSGGQPQFADVRAQCGVRSPGTAMDALWFDCNNDGWLDLYLCSAFPGRRSYLYVNDGRGAFHDLTFIAGAGVTDTWGGALADYDADGDVDLLLCSPDGVRLLRNDTPPQGWLEIACTGNTLGKAGMGSNGAALGTRITLSTEYGTLVRELQSATGTGCGNELLAHFGLGQTRGRISIVVRFPSGQTATRALMQGNQRLVFNEGQEALPQVEAAPADAVTPPPEAEPDAAKDETTSITRPTGGRGT